MLALNNLYRPCVGVAMINKDCKVFVGRRINDHKNIWQMPQGGINKNESPINAAYRELQEETGVDGVKIIAQINRWLYYDIPSKISQKTSLRKYKGQKQLWFLVYFDGNTSMINLESSDMPEFCQWRWSDWGEICDNVISFKKNVYKQVVQTFQPIAVEFTEKIHTKEKLNNKI